MIAHSSSTDHVQEQLAGVTAAQNARLQAEDPALGSLGVPSLETAHRVLTAGDLVGVWTRSQTPPDSSMSLWSALTQDILAVRSADPIPTADFSQLLQEFSAACQTQPVDAERELVVRLPVLEVDATTALIEHGFRPRASTAVHRLVPTATAPPSPSEVQLREARGSDLAQITDLLVEMHASDCAHGGGFHRPREREFLGQMADQAIGREGWTWVAVRDGKLSGVACLESEQEAAWASAATSWGPMVYVGLVAVDARQRAGGIGAALVQRMHERGREAGAQVSLLDHAALSPLSATFWHRRGYRPLWTTWVRSPLQAAR